jgi:hypothetical protein
VTTLFFSYSHRDEALRDQLEVQLAMLKRQGIIEAWHDRRIGAGERLHEAIDTHVRQDDIILLLVSPDFLASDYCYDVEVKTALERHRAGDAIVIPVILRPCDWIPAFGFLNATPRDGKAITTWPNEDEAFLEVAKAVRAAAESQRKAAEAADPAVPAAQPPKSHGIEAVNSSPQTERAAGMPPTIGRSRSSNLRLAKAFTAQDRDRFLLDAFEFIARYFESSLQELAERNAGYEGAFRRVDSGRFFATIYHHGDDVARATIFLGDGSGFGHGIHYLANQSTSSNSMNESLRVEADDQTMFLAPLGMSMFAHNRQQALTPEGGAEHYWSMLIAPLQGR